MSSKFEIGNGSGLSELVLEAAVDEKFIVPQELEALFEENGIEEDVQRWYRLFGGNPTPQEVWTYDKNWQMVSVFGILPGYEHLSGFITKDRLMIEEKSQQMMAMGVRSDVVTRFFNESGKDEYDPTRIGGFKTHRVIYEDTPERLRVGVDRIGYRPFGQYLEVDICVNEEMVETDIRYQTTLFAPNRLDTMRYDDGALGFGGPRWQKMNIEGHMDEEGGFQIDDVNDASSSHKPNKLPYVVTDEGKLVVFYDPYKVGLLNKEHGPIHEYYVFDTDQVSYESIREFLALGDDHTKDNSRFIPIEVYEELPDFITVDEAERLHRSAYELQWVTTGDILLNFIHSYRERIGTEGSFDVENHRDRSTGLTDQIRYLEDNVQYLNRLRWKLHELTSLISVNDLINHPWLYFASDPRGNQLFETLLPKIWETPVVETAVEKISVLSDVQLVKQEIAKLPWSAYWSRVIDNTERFGDSVVDKLQAHTESLHARDEEIRQQRLTLNRHPFDFDMEDKARGLAKLSQYYKEKLRPSEELREAFEKKWRGYLDENALNVWIGEREDLNETYSVGFEDETIRSVPEKMRKDLRKDINALMHTHYLEANLDWISVACLEPWGRKLQHAAKSHGIFGITSLPNDAPVNELVFDLVQGLSNPRSLEAVVKAVMAKDQLSRSRSSGIWQSEVLMFHEVIQHAFQIASKNPDYDFKMIAIDLMEKLNITRKQYLLND